MPKRKVVKERALKELYEITKRLSEPEITPVLKGSCRIQGPVDEDQELRTNKVLSAEENFGSPAETIRMRAESGTCNVCAAPCSSCMHFNRTISAMESKIEDDCSDVICKGKEPLFKSRACDDRQHTASDASNLISTCSSHDSLCENAESKVTVRTGETSDGVEDVEMQPKLSPNTEEGEHTTQCNTSSQSAITSHTSIPLATSQMISSQDNKQQGPEHHGDNISCVTGVKETNTLVSDSNGNSDRNKSSPGDALTSSVVVEGLEKSSQVELASACVTDSCPRIEDGKNNSTRSSTSTKGTFHKKEPDLTSETAGVSECPSSKDVCEGSVTKKSQLTLSPSKSKPSSKIDPKDSEEKSGCHLEADPGECVLEHLESSSAGQVMATIDDGKKESAAPESTDGKQTVVKSNSATGSLVKIHPFSETEIGMNGKDAQAESIKKSDLTQEVENPNPLLQASNNQETQQSPNHDDENSESDILEDDVKVCDICGDAGREDLLAICNRCSDGAEHTYCMRVMLDKVPEGDWLCEECQLKEDAEKQKLNKKALEEDVSAVPKAPPLSEKSQHLNTRPLPKLDTKAEEEEEKVTKIIASPRASTKRLSESPEVTPLSKKVAIEASSGTPRMSALCKGSVLSRESSFKHMDLAKAKPVNPLPSSGSQPTNSSQEAAYTHSASGSITSKLQQQLKSPPSSGSQPTNSSQEAAYTHSTSGSITSKLQQQLKSPRGSLSRSATFNSLKHKVKQLPEDFSQNLKLTSSGVRKDGLIRPVGKSISFKSTGLSQSNSNDSKGKLQSASFSRAAVDPRGLKQAKDPMLERKNSSKVDRPIFSLSSAMGTNMSHLKSDLKGSLRGDPVPSHSLTSNALDLKAAQHNGKRHTLSKTANLMAHDGFESKKHAPLSRGPGVSSNGTCISEEQKSSPFGPKEDLTASPLGTDKISGSSDAHVNDIPTTHPDVKTKDSTLSRSKHTVSSGSKNVRCQRCNEIGHDTQACKEGSLQFPASKDSAVRNLRDTINKSSKWKDVAEAVLPKMRKNDRLGNQPDELTVSNTDINCQVASKDHLPSSSGCAANVPSLGGAFLVKDALRRPLIDSTGTSTAFNLQQHHMEEPVCSSREADLNFVPTVTDETKLKHPSAGSPFQASVLGKPLRISAIPEHDYIWQGSFEVQRSGTLIDSYDGIQAHLSTCASPRVLEVVNKFPSRIQLVEAPRQTMWPAQFQGNCTTEENIALYFFARDIHSYERNYQKLLENMQENDLALKGNLDGIELLVFPSNQLHEKSQRWNSLFFLWAVFRERSCSESVANSHKKLCGAILDAQSREQDLPAAVADNELQNERSPEAKAAKSILGIPPSLSSSGQVVASLGHRCLSSQEVNRTDVVDKHSPEGHPSCSSSETHSLPSAGEQGYQPGNPSLLRMTDNDAQLRSEEKDSSTSLKETYRDSGDRSNNELQPTGIQATTIQIDLNEETGSEGSGSEEIINAWNKEDLAKSGASEDEMHVEKITKEQQGSHFWSGRKRLHNDSLETASEVSGKMFDVSSQTAPWEKAECTEIDRENESKKMKLHHDLDVGSSNQGQMLGDGFSSMAKNADPVFLKGKGGCSYDFAIPLFPVDTDPISNCKSGSPSQWQALISDIKDLPEPDIPNLELALGAEKKPSRQGSLPWLSRSVNERNSQSKLPLTDDSNDDISSSLSLSLAFPFSRKEQSMKPSTKPEQLLPEKNHVNTSLLLFRGFPDP